MSQATATARPLRSPARAPAARAAAPTPLRVIPARITTTGSGVLRGDLRHPARHRAHRAACCSTRPWRKGRSSSADLQRESALLSETAGDLQEQIDSASASGALAQKASQLGMVRSNERGSHRHQRPARSRGPPTRRAGPTPSTVVTSPTPVAKPKATKQKAVDDDQAVIRCCAPARRRGGASATASAAGPTAAPTPATPATARSRRPPPTPADADEVNRDQLQARTRRRRVPGQSGRQGAPDARVGARGRNTGESGRGVRPTRGHDQEPGSHPGGAACGAARPCPAVARARRRRGAGLRGGLRQRGHGRQADIPASVDPEPPGSARPGRQGVRERRRGRPPGRAAPTAHLRGQPARPRAGHVHRRALPLQRIRRPARCESRAFDASAMQAAALSKRPIKLHTPAMRGQILDTNGHVLADSVERFTIAADPGRSSATSRSGGECGWQGVHQAAARPGAAARRRRRCASRPCSPSPTPVTSSSRRTSPRATGARSRPSGCPGARRSAPPSASTRPPWRSASSWATSTRPTRRQEAASS